MPLHIQLAELSEPLLEFGGTGLYADPKIGLEREGPLSLRYDGGQPQQVRLGLVGPAEATDAAARWFERCQHRILSTKTNRQRFPDFPGFNAIFRTSLGLASRWTIEFEPSELSNVLSLEAPRRFDAIVDLYANGVSTLAQREMGPNVVVCCLSDSILEQCAVIAEDTPTAPVRSRGRHDQSSKDHPQQLALPFDSGEDDLVGRTAEERLLYRTFHRALKAHVMLSRFRLPIQIAHNHLFEDGPHKDDAATRAWSVSVGLFYKAGGIPWRLAAMQPHVCFVGISFHRLETTQRQAMYASMAQAFSTDIEGFVLRGERIPERKDRQPYLTAEQAERIGSEILKQYQERSDRPPVRMTIHKTTQFAPEEREGFRSAFRDIPEVEWLAFPPAKFRLFPAQDYPPRRGTLCTVNSARHFLYTTGYYPDWGTYPGPHVPEPLEIISDACQDTDLRRIAEEVLGLTKMNYNSASVVGRDPITLHMASYVGPIMTEVPENEEPALTYRYYM